MRRSAVQATDMWRHTHRPLHCAPLLPLLLSPLWLPPPCPFLCRCFRLLITPCLALVASAATCCTSTRMESSLTTRPVSRQRRIAGRASTQTRSAAGDRAARAQRSTSAIRPAPHCAPLGGVAQRKYDADDCCQPTSIRRTRRLAIVAGRDESAVVIGARPPPLACLHCLTRVCWLLLALSVCSGLHKWWKAHTRLNGQIIEHISPYQQKVVSTLFTNLPDKLKHKVVDNWHFWPALLSIGYFMHWADHKYHDLHRQEWP